MRLWRWWRWLVRLVLGALLVAAGWRVWRSFEAARIVRAAPTLENFERARRLDPSNDRYPFRLGTAHRDRPEIRDLDEARTYLERAVELNPYSWRYRRELAQLYELTGRIREAERAYLEAIARSPKSGSYRWRLANFYVRHGSFTDAAAQLEVALEADRGLLPAAFGLLRKAGASRRELEDVWPGDRPARAALLGLLCGAGEAPSEVFGLPILRRIWDGLVSSDPPLGLAEGDACVRYLLRSGEPAVARHAWIELAGVHGLDDEAFASRRSLVWNGGFDLETTATAFDWHFWNADGCTARVAAGEGLESAALRIDFDGTANAYRAGVEQRLAVEPGRTLTLAYSARSEALTTDRGLFFEVAGVESGRILLAAEPILGTRPWTRVSTRFSTEGEKFVILRLARTPSLRLDNLPRGTVWIDSVSVGVTPP